jgi:hypothetical protein
LANLYERFGIPLPKKENDPLVEQTIQENNVSSVPQSTSEAESLSPFMSGLTGFNTSVAQIPEGVAQMLANVIPSERLKASVKGVHEKTKADYEEAKKANPKSAMAGYALGEVGQAAAIPASIAGRLGFRGKPAINYLANLAKSGGEGALIGGALAGSRYVEDRENRLDNTLAGGALGGGLSLGIGLIPGVYQAGKYALTKGAPVTENLANQEAVRFGTQGINPNDSNIANKMQAVDDLAAQGYRTFLSPGEASGLPVLKAREGNPFLLTEGSQQKIQEQILNREKSFRRLIDDTVNKIVPEGNQILQGKKDFAYQEAHKGVIPMREAYELLKDEVIANANNKALKNPALRKQLKNVELNSIEYLDTLKRDLNDEYSKLAEKGYKKKGPVLSGIKDSIDKIIEKLDSYSPINPETKMPYYAEARKLAERQIAKRSITDLTDKIKPLPGNSEITANQFYDHLLASRGQFNKFVGNLEKIEDPTTREIAMSNAKKLRTLLNSISDTNLNRNLSKSLVSSTRLPTGLREIAGQKIRAFFGQKKAEAFADILPSREWYDELQKISKLTSEKAKVKRFTDFIEAQDIANAVAFQLGKNTDNNDEEM